MSLVAVAWAATVTSPGAKGDSPVGASIHTWATPVVTVVASSLATTKAPAPPTTITNGTASFAHSIGAPIGQTFGHMAPTRRTYRPC